VVLTLAGLIMLLGTIDEYKAGRAFDRAMTNYAARDFEGAHEALQEAMSAKSDYYAPQEAYGTLLVRDARLDPSKYAKAREIFEDLSRGQESALGRPSLPVLVGLAVAELGAEEAKQGASVAGTRAGAQARVRLQEAGELHPSVGDAYVNLATVALLDDKLAECKRHLAKVHEVGNVSVDALPYLYNLSGLVALREGRFQDAVKEFEKVKEFEPRWEIPRLNLAAAYAQGMVRGNLKLAAARRYERNIREIIDSLERDKKTENPLYAIVCHSLAVHYIRMAEPSMALRYLARVGKHRPLNWHAQFNRAVASGVAAKRLKKGHRDRKALIAEARRVLTPALKSPLATRRAVFVASCLLGSLDNDEKKAPEAIAHFERAARAAAKSSDRFLREAAPHVLRSLAALYYTEGRYKEALSYLKKSAGVPDPQKLAERLIKQLGERPSISGFSARIRKIRTDYDLHITANVAATATPRPVAPEDVGLTLTNALDPKPRTIPFRLIGSNLRAVVLNLPQGRFRLQLQVTDGVGNQSNVAAEQFEIDREPPRVLDRHPTPGATVKKLDAVRFRVHDVISKVDFTTLSATLRYPAGSEKVSRMLVSRGKYAYGTKDGAVKRGEPVEAKVECPIPGRTPRGEYTLSVRVQDSLGKTREAAWSFTIAP